MPLNLTVFASGLLELHEYEVPHVTCYLPPVPISHLITI